MERIDFLNRIKKNIENNEYHITFVFGGQHPDFAYSIGITEKLGYELVLAGGAIVPKKIPLIFESIYKDLKSGKNTESKFSVSGRGDFYLRKVDCSWSKYLMLGVYDYYSSNEISAFQIFPVDTTIDIPKMSIIRNIDDNIWKWQDLDWNLNAPRDSYVITNFDALKGEAIIYIDKCEENEWEMYTKSPDEIQSNEYIKVPLGTILGIDDTLNPCLSLGVNEGLWREDKDSEWQVWE